LKYICVEGCLGIGKTTIAKMLASKIYNSNLLLEDFESHPFLDDFYKNELFTFETEINFLLIHYHQLLKATTANPGILVSDYAMYKDVLFADANLENPVEHKLFMDMYDYLITKMPKPDTIICLSGSDRMIYDRIIKRNRAAEQNVSFDYIKRINSHYNRLFKSFKERNINTIDIDMGKNDFVGHPDLLNDLLKSVM
jgi:deoxyadenosine/deoxycytidine kinase